MKLRMQALRERRGWTRAALSRVALLQPPRVSAIELGRATPAGDSVELLRLKIALSWSGAPVELLDRVDDEVDE